MIISRPVYHLLRITLEAKSAHAIHTGHGDTINDSLVMRDANGLPALSGSSLAGILRREYRHQHGEVATNLLFGYADGSEGQTSWLNVGWGLTHNSQNQALEGLLKYDQLNDSLFVALSDPKPIVRQRVRLNERGTSVDSGKFDVTLIPAGTRYSLFVSFWGDDSEESCQQWSELRELFTHQNIRVGHGTNNGYGLFESVLIHEAIWDLTTEEGQQAYCNRGRARMNYNQMVRIVPNTRDDKAALPLSAVLDLTAESAWRIGGGEKYLDATQLNQADFEAPDMLPMHEAKVYWKTNADGSQKGVMSEQQYLLPASAIKGAIRHRVAYHYNCLCGRFVDDDNSYNTDNSPAIKALFGFAKDNESIAGLLSFYDIYLEPDQQQILMHNKIDRFTGGVMNGALFSENILWNSQVKIRIDVTKPDKISDPLIKKALHNALHDLAKGWLPLGASGSRGLGVFIDIDEKGVQWSDNQAWISMEGVAS